MGQWVSKIGPSCGDINVQHVAVQANYFKVNFASSPDLRRYRIQLDQINSKDIVKRELRRALIKALLEQHPPSGIWVSDYFEYIVSVDKLYPVCSDSAGTVTNVLHHRPGRNGTWVAMQSSIIYEGSFQRSALQAHVASNTSSFVPDAELRMDEYYIMVQYQWLQCAECGIV
ncbi:hypothetical protein OCU04_006010 [Sclerotinia nivalis]|uniref:Uncharacterized protein n=1 Tax=Sclerotinia nivalis TaxID=352851 RepID=A0A9X0AMC2_9HELO|nr:hypothetical protein OCU04_006010 [Sclerotinia nivalis]